MEYIVAYLIVTVLAIIGLRTHENYNGMPEDDMLEYLGLLGLGLLWPFLILAGVVWVIVYGADCFYDYFEGENK